MPPRGELAEEWFPSLLDRLRDEHPREEIDAPQSIRSDEETYRRSVIRDIEHLLNATPPPPRLLADPATLEDSLLPAERAEGELPPLSCVARSVLFYGLDLPVGDPVSDELKQLLGHRLKATLEAYEPRLLDVRITRELLRDPDAWWKGQREPTRPCFLIQARLFATRVPEEIQVRTELDLIGGRVSVGESDLPSLRRATS